MKNKEIEELLNELKDNNDWYVIENKEEHNTEPYKLLLPTERNLLLSYIEQLENLCNKYEQEHKTTFEIWKKDIKKLEQLENNRDKAIEEIDNLLVYNEYSDTTKGFGNVPEQLKFYLSDYDNLEDFRNSLKGDSDD